MADKDGMERKVWVLPTELSDRIKVYQQSQGVASEVEAARRLLDAALQMRDSVLDILIKLKAKFDDEKELRVLARDVLTPHILVTDIKIEDKQIVFRLKNGDCGSLDDKGRIYSGDSTEYMSEIKEPKRTATPQQQTAQGGDLDDEIPF